MFHQNYEEDHHYEDLNLEDKIPLNTYNTLRNQPSALSPLYQSQQLKARESTLDISFQNQIYSNNAQLIQLNMIQYFNSSLKQKITTEVVFRDGLLFSFQGQQESTDTHFLSNILQNKHLTKAQRKVFENCYKQFQEFRAFLEELSRLFGKSIGKELGYLIGIILENKLQPYKSLKSTTFPMFLPQFPRFYGEEQSEILLNDSNHLECSLDYCEIKKFAIIGVEDFCTKIYFSNNIQFLNLKKITVDLSENVNLIQKFTSFMESLSETVFLTLAGYSLQEQQLDMFKEEINLNLVESPHGILNNSLSKKVKYDFL